MALFSVCHLQAACCAAEGWQSGSQSSLSAVGCEDSSVAVSKVPGAALKQQLFSSAFPTARLPAQSCSALLHVAHADLSRGAALPFLLPGIVFASSAAVCTAAAHRPSAEGADVCAAASLRAGQGGALLCSSALPAPCPQPCRSSAGTHRPREAAQRMSLVFLPLLSQCWCLLLSEGTRARKGLKPRRGFLFHFYVNSVRIA